ncbi:J domain-containing protein [Nitrosococcus wardiae]|uniref:Molecular chaperone DnaJ n=1 Tax=Nitrosococcus wardiae TaxID=1814290 RepID=A0A4V1AWD3_9GAMM|nr:J domain-containing protein [Nitrosococcus wardiae]QBQ56235.1 molecular chaperone DnaJ [Nitrosococcus wardiae]
MKNKLRTHYDNLQVTENASDEVIKGAYKYLSQKWHPDKNPECREKAEKILRIINAAYEVLSDPEKRRAHDEWIHEQRKKQEAAQGKKEENKGENQEHEESERTQEEIERERARQERERQIELEKLQSQQAVVREYERRAAGKGFNNVRAILVTLANMGATLATLAIFGYLTFQINSQQSIDITAAALAIGMILGLLLFGIGRFFIGTRGPRYSSMVFISTVLVCTTIVGVRYVVGPSQKTFTSTQPSYDKLLVDYERRYPKINSPQAEKTQLPFHTPSIESTPGRRNCELKSVMTDRDYRACGITPPQAR